MADFEVHPDWGVITSMKGMDMENINAIVVEDLTIEELAEFAGADSTSTAATVSTPVASVSTSGSI